jgi:hypothetical protein
LKRKLLKKVSNIIDIIEIILTHSPERGEETYISKGGIYYGW